MDFKAFEFKRTGGGLLREFCDGNSWRFEYTENGITRTMPLYEINGSKRIYDRLYLGHTLDEVLSSGRDLLGEELLKNGEISYEDIKGILPEICDDAYCFLGGAASHGGITVDKMGVATPQLSGRDRMPKPLFAPSAIDPMLADIKPRQCLLGGEYPLLCSVFEAFDDITELIYFVEPGDSDRDPILWIRVKRYKKSAPEGFDIKYRVTTFSRELTEEEMANQEISEDIFLDSMADTVAYCVKFSERGSKLALPEEELQRVAKGAILAAATSFTAGAPHYGHKFYGKELHDNFPPNYIWSIETACLLGHGKWAKKITEYMLDYALTDEGKFCYRQGSRLKYGASATEYGMLLFIFERYKRALGLSELSDEYREKLCGMGNIILAHAIPCPEFGGRVLIKMCAEADTNNRVNVYLNNNLWSIRGLRALSELVGDEKYRQSADVLEKNIAEMIEEYGVKNTRFGDLAPFRFGYTAMPLTLSNCLDTFRPMTEEEASTYFVATKSRGVDTAEQDITENTYSNYRYYPELLSAMLLPKNYADGIVNMRESIGGELLGMTRFRSWIDNWPVLHYARFLIETGRIEKYLMLLYAHTAHHGHPLLMCYYEQIKLFGKVSAPDCVPSLLTTPAMVGWMFAYERIADGVLCLLSALPKDWYGKPFTAEKLGYSKGSVSLKSDGTVLEIEFSDGCPDGCELVWRANSKLDYSNIILGKEYISEIKDNKLILKTGITHMQLCIK